MTAASDAARPAVAIFVQRFLSDTMTFVYRQVSGVRRHADPLLLTTELRNGDLFPFAPRVECRVGAARRAALNAAQNGTGRVLPLSARQLDVFARAARAHGVGLVHAHFGPAGIRALPLALRLGVPLAVSFHGYDASKALRFRAYRRALRALFGSAHAIANSADMAERLIDAGAHPARVHVVPYGVARHPTEAPARVAIRDKVARGEPVELLQVASFARKKGQRYTLLAFRSLLDTYPGSRLGFVGDGPLRRRAERLARRLGIAARVRFLGPARPEQVPAHLAAADLFVHHSVTLPDGDREGMPNAILEAMAAGLPVVSSLHAGIPEYVADGVCGRLVPERDVAAYARALREALDFGPEPGRRARALARERFSEERESRALGELYRKLAAC